MAKVTKLSLALPIIASLALTACGDNNNEQTMQPTVPVTPAPTPVTYSYQVAITNLTKAQPLSPSAVLLHDEGQLWQLGSAASEALENLAESGNNAMVLASSFALTTAAASDVLKPGDTVQLELMLTDHQAKYLSFATMLVNTNDAFTGLNALDISELASGSSISMRLGAYDAGTELNDEIAAHIPGPAGQGEGFNAERNDVLNKVTMHQGVVTADDGLGQSTLTADHKFDNPVIAVTVTRL